MQSTKQKLTELYEGDSDRAHRFRYILLLADIATIIYLVASTFFYGQQILYFIDLFFGFYIAIDYFIRLWIAPKKFSFLVDPINLGDLIAVISVLLPLLGVNMAFLRALRVLRLLRTYRLQGKLREDFEYFKKNEDVILSATNLFIFIFLMTELVFITQVNINPNVKNFLDAMYFTITTLTTTGFGDITLQGNSGRAISIIVMIFGVSLFLRLIKSIYQPSKVRFVCDSCGLFLHERDAVHCKHCGRVLNTPSDGEV